MLFFVVTLLLFFALDAAWFPDRLDSTPAQRRPLAAALHTFAHGTRSYLLVSTVFGLIVAVLDTGALWLLGVPAPLVWGLLAFITNYIPNIGFVIGLIPPMILGLLVGGLPLMLAVLAVYCVLNVVIQSVIQPRVVGGAVGLSGSLTFLSLVVWAWLLGALGALLAVPAEPARQGAARRHRLGREVAQPPDRRQRPGHRPSQRARRGAGRGAGDRPRRPADPPIVARPVIPCG